MNYSGQPTSPLQLGACLCPENNHHYKFEMRHWNKTILKQESFCFALIEVIPKTKTKILQFCSL